MRTREEIWLETFTNRRPEFGGNKVWNGILEVLLDIREQITRERAEASKYYLEQAELEIRQAKKEERARVVEEIRGKIPSLRDINVYGPYEDTERAEAFIHGQISVIGKCFSLLDSITKGTE